MTTFTMERVSKWTIAILADGIKIETAKSMKKAVARVEELQKAEKPTKPAKKKLKLKKKAKKAAKKGSSIKDSVIALMSAGKTNEQIIGEIQSNFPDSAFKQSHATWYRANLVRSETILEEFSARNMRAKLKANN